MKVKYVEDGKSKKGDRILRSEAEQRSCKVIHSWRHGRSKCSLYVLSNPVLKRNKVNRMYYKREFVRMAYKH